MKGVFDPSMPPQRWEFGGGYAALKPLARFSILISLCTTSSANKCLERVIFVYKDMKGLI
jgi:hypothetical protein